MQRSGLGRAIQVQAMQLEHGHSQRLDMKANYWKKERLGASSPRYQFESIVELIIKAEIKAPALKCSYCEAMLKLWCH